MITAKGINNQTEEAFGTFEDYKESFYSNLNLELDADTQAELEPLIGQAHDKGIPTLDLVEIVRSGING